MFAYDHGASLGVGCWFSLLRVCCWVLFVACSLLVGVGCLLLCVGYYHVVCCIETFV